MGAFAGEDFMAGLGYQDIIFYSHAESAGNINARLNGDDLAGLEGALAF